MPPGGTPLECSGGVEVDTGASIAANAASTTETRDEYTRYGGYIPSGIDIHRPSRGSSFLFRFSLRILNSPCGIAGPPTW